MRISMRADYCASTRTHAPHTHTHTHAQPQINYTHYRRGYYAVEADAATARDLVAKVLGSRLNFTKPRKVTGQRSEGADQAVADAVKALAKEKTSAPVCQVRTE